MTARSQYRVRYWADKIRNQHYIKEFRFLSTIYVSAIMCKYPDLTTYRQYNHAMHNAYFFLHIFSFQSARYLNIMFIFYIKHSIHVNVKKLLARRKIEVSWIRIFRISYLCLVLRSTTTNFVNVPLWSSETTSKNGSPAPVIQTLRAINFVERRKRSRYCFSEAAASSDSQRSPRLTQTILREHNPRYFVHVGSSTLKLNSSSLVGSKVGPKSAANRLETWSFPAHWY